MMKKTLALLLALMMVFTFAVAETVADLTGEWYLATMVYEGTEYSAADFGMNMILTLNADGTATMASDDQSAPATWEATADGFNYTSEDSTVAFVFDGEKLSADEDGTVLIFTREAPVATNFGEVVPQEDAAAFNGSWNCEYINMLGMVVPMSAATPEELEQLLGSADLTVVVADGTVTCFGDETAMELKDGALTDAEGTVVVELTDTGYLSISMSMGMVILYCTPIVPVQE